MPLWTSTPEAAALLADCAANPPAKTVKAYRFGDTDTVLHPRDRRVSQLRVIYRAAEPELDTPAWREWLSMPVETAVANAVAGALTLEAAE